MKKVPPDKAALDKIKRKRLFKLNGKVEEIVWLFTNKTLRVVLYKGTGKNKSIYAFTAFGKNAMALSEYKKNDRLKVFFKIDTKKVDKNYYNNLIIEEFDFWPVNEEKIKKKAYKDAKQAEIEYRHSDTEENTGFLNQGVTPHEDQL